MGPPRFGAGKSAPKSAVVPATLCGKGCWVACRFLFWFQKPHKTKIYRKHLIPDDLTPSEDKAEVARRNCRDKCSEITLTNHKTAFNALNGLGEVHVKNLKHMGYSFERTESARFRLDLQV